MWLEADNRLSFLGDLSWQAEVKNLSTDRFSSLLPFLDAGTKAMTQSFMQGCWRSSNHEHKGYHRIDQLPIVGVLLLSSPSTQLLGCQIRWVVNCIKLVSISFWFCSYSARISLLHVFNTVLTLYSLNLVVKEKEERGRKVWSRRKLKNLYGTIIRLY